MSSKIMLTPKIDICPDVDIVEGIQNGSNKILDSFFKKTANYFSVHFQLVVTNKSQIGYERTKDKDDLFAESFECLWTEIEDRRIFVKDKQVYRINREGIPQKLNSNLTTFLMAIARNKYHEHERDNWGDVVLDDFSNIFVADNSMQRIMEMSEKEIKIQIIDDCIEKMQKHCKDILTMFYIANMSLDDILSERKENISKDGLKTGKYKCLKSLKTNVIEECNRRGIAI